MFCNENGMYKISYKNQLSTNRNNWKKLSQHYKQTKKYTGSIWIKPFKNASTRWLRQSKWLKPLCCLSLLLYFNPIFWKKQTFSFLLIYFNTAYTIWRRRSVISCRDDRNGSISIFDKSYLHRYRLVVVELFTECVRK